MCFTSNPTICQDKITKKTRTTKQSTYPYVFFPEQYNEAQKDI